MSSTVHPMIKLADESIQKIDRQLDCSSLYFNSKSLKTSMNSKKKRGIKIGNKITYILGPGAQILTPTSNLGFSSKVLKASKVVIEGKYTPSIYLIWILWMIDDKSFSWTNKN